MMSLKAIITILGITLLTYVSSVPDRDITESSFDAPYKELVKVRRSPHPRPRKRNSESSGASESSRTDAIVFGEEAPPSAATCLTNETYVEETRSCVGVLTRGPCLVGQWVIVDSKTNKARCASHPAECGAVKSKKSEKCARAALKLRNGVSGSKPLSCDGKNGRTPAFTKSGDIVCGCRPGFIYWDADDKCYEAFSKGPCKDGEYIILAGEEAECAANVCPRGLIPINLKSTKNPGRQVMEDTVCAELDSELNCAEGSMIAINPTTYQPDCLAADLDLRSAMDSVSLLDCNPGERRSRDGVCIRTRRFGG